MSAVLTRSEAARLSEDELRELHGLLLAQLDERYRDDEEAWLEEQVWTLDEASAEIRRWPAEKNYLRELGQAIREENLLAIPKSRRMLVTLRLAAYCTHRIRYEPANAIFWQSQNEDKAAEVVNYRCAFIEDHLDDPELRRPYQAHRTSAGKIGRMTYAGTGSYIVGIPQGADAIRSFTGTVLVMDEIEHQEQGREALVAAIPLVEKRAKLILVGSSNGPRGVLAELCRSIGFVRFA